MNIRVIPRLDIKGPNLVKGIHLEGLRVLGKPEAFARYYFETGADELFYQDVVASLYDRNSLKEVVSRTAREIFIPMTVGGGLRNTDDIKEILRAGADKVSLNTAAIRNPQLVREASRMFGSSTIVVAIEAIRESDGRYLAFTDNGRETTGLEVLEWAQRAEELGAGEIILTSVDRDGTGEGFDIELIKMVANAVSIPVIAHGGAGSIEHIISVIKQGNANAVALASCLHYKAINRIDILDNYAAEGNTEFLKNKNLARNIGTYDLAEVKWHMTKSGISCRSEIGVANERRA